MFPVKHISAGQGGGDEGNRTLNPRLAKAVLCQLSYVPGCGVLGLAGRLAPDLRGRPLLSPPHEVGHPERCQHQHDQLHDLHASSPTAPSSAVANPAGSSR